MPTGGRTAARPRRALGRTAGRTASHTAGRTAGRSLGRPPGRPSGRARPHRRARTVTAWAASVAAVVVVAVVAGTAVTIWLLGNGSQTGTGSCQVSTAPAAGGGSTTYSLTPEQARNAATIAAVGSRMGLPNHAVTVALAAALQESKLRNLSYGDRDSMGLFQQRPSQGWGTAEQISDPVYAATAFYQHLQRVPGWQTMSVTAAAQRVQQSNAPGAYAQWEGTARVAAAALTGETAAGLTCSAMDVAHPTGDLPDVAAAELGTSRLSGAHETARGWAIASWLVAHAGDLGVSRVSFGGRVWTAESGSWAPGGAPAGVLSLERAAG